MDLIELEVREGGGRIDDPRGAIVLIPRGLTPVTGPYEFLTIVRACDQIRPDIATPIAWICEMIEAGAYV